jgi:hypothetical protein
MKEVWKEIPGYKDYQVSSKGRVLSFKNVKPRMIKQVLSTSGYNTVMLYINGKGSRLAVHQLVAIAFLGHKPAKGVLVIDHINRDKLDNRLENLIETNMRGNMENTDKSNHTSNYVGVSYDKKSKMYKSSIQHNKKRYYLGYFKSELEAYKARLDKLKALTEWQLKDI